MITILILLFVGAFAAHPIAGAQDDHGHSVHDFANVAEFIKDMEMVHKEGEVEKLSELFSDNFYFRGCKSNYNKQQIIATVNKQEKYRRATFKLEMSENTSGVTVVLLSIGGVKGPAMHSIYLIDTNKQKILNGYNVDCEGQLQLLGSGSSHSTVASATNNGDAK